MIECHVCHTGDVIEGAPPRPSAFDSLNLRDEAMGLWGMCRFATQMRSKVIEKCEVMLYYACEVTSGRKKVPVNVPEMIAEWKQTVVVLCTAHGKDEIDKAEFRMDELLKPLLKAPVAEIREFYAGLLLALKDDPQVPFFIWRLFSAWGEVVLEKANKDAPPRALKKKLAGEVAELALTSQTRTDLVDALVGALQWRSPEALVEMRDALQDGGAKPRIKGRESCLFLVAEKRGVEKATVML